MENSDNCNKIITRDKKQKTFKKHFSHHPKPVKSPAQQRCRNCNKNWPHKGGQKNCPAYGKKCNLCLKPNHFASVCKSSASANNTFKKHIVTNLNENSDSDSDSESDFVFSAKDAKGKLPHFDITINDLHVNALTDSGATVNLLSIKYFNNLKSKPKNSLLLSKIPV